MPRATPFASINDAEMTFARKFAMTGLIAGLGIPLEDDLAAGLLVNTKNKMTYGVVPCPMVDGRLLFFIDPNTTLPLAMKTQPKWLVLADVNTSKIHLIVWDNLFPHLREAMAKPHAGLFVQTGNVVSVNLHVEWAQSVGILAKSIPVKLGKQKYLQARGSQFATDDQFGHLHVHSMYSLLDGASTIDGLAEKVAMNGQTFCALTDHGAMYGTWKFYKACRDWGIKPLLGCEVYLVDDAKKRYQHDGKDRRFEYHQTIIAMNQTGWANLNKILSKACRDDFYYVPRTDHKTLFEHNEGLIILSGCFKGPVAWHLQEFDPPKEPGEILPVWYRTDPDHSYRIAKMYREVLGDRYYIEKQSIDFARYMKALPKICQLSDDLGIPGVVTNDCHYEVAEDAVFQAMLTKVNSGTKVDAIGEGVKKDGVYFMKTRDEIDPMGLLQPADFTRTCEIADRCTLEFPKGFLFPKYDVQADEDWQAYQGSKAA